MSNAKVSVIIPAYNGAKDLGAAIQSVLVQTYPNFELVIVDDASVDNTAEIVAQFDDSRIKYIVQKVNKGVDAARRLAIESSSGEILAFLDQDDLYHPEKLEAHVNLYAAHPEIGFSYNSRFELNHSANSIRGIWRPPQKITLADLILGFPIAPSEMVLRRKWAPFIDLSAEPTLIHGGEYVITGRLFLSGCQFGSIDRVLNYRRHHAQRTFSKLAVRCESELEAQQRIFADTRCPSDVMALRNTAFANTYKLWAYVALLQDETALGQQYLREAIRLDPLILKGKHCELVNFFLIWSIDDENHDHAALLKQIFAQLPSEIAYLSKEYDWAVARGYLLKGVRAVIWDRPADADRHFARAAELGARFDESLVSQLTRDLLNYETAFGEAAVQQKIRALSPYLAKLGGSANVRKLSGRYSVNRAFQSYSVGEYAQVPRCIVPAIASDPRYLTNRGVLSILIHSIFASDAQSTQDRSGLY